MTGQPPPPSLVRTARPGDVPGILRLIRALATYEREPDAVVTTEDDLNRALFPRAGAPTAFAHVAEVVAGPPEPGRALAGFALWFVTFSTWTGTPGIWLEDVFVRPEYRGLGLGRELLGVLAAECRRRGYARLDFSVLDWNTPSIEFYRHLGATSLDAWTQYRLQGNALLDLASETSGPADG